MRPGSSAWFSAAVLKDILLGCRREAIWYLAATHEAIFWHTRECPVTCRAVINIPLFVGVFIFEQTSLRFLKVFLVLLAVFYQFFILLQNLVSSNAELSICECDGTVSLHAVEREK